MASICSGSTFDKNSRLSFMIMVEGRHKTRCLASNGIVSVLAQRPCSACLSIPVLPEKASNAASMGSPSASQFFSFSCLRRCLLQSAAVLSHCCEYRMIFLVDGGLINMHRSRGRITFTVHCQQSVLDNHGGNIHLVASQRAGFIRTDNRYGGLSFLLLADGEQWHFSWPWFERRYGRVMVSTAGRPSGMALQSGQRLP